MKLANAGRTQPLIDGEFPLTKEDFQHIAGIAMSDAGIDLNEAKASLVYSRLTKRLRAAAAAKLPELLRATIEWRRR